MNIEDWKKSDLKIGEGNVVTSNLLAKFIIFWKTDGSLSTGGQL